MEHPIVTQRNALAARCLDLELAVLERDKIIADLEEKIKELRGADDTAD